ncbi:MAG: hypothetical protein FWE45_02590 [Firmicutes bacterium]|nr:hypothetical protein [Bacillota bacterium]
MMELLPIIIVSIVAVAAIILLAFIPVRIGWFFKDAEDASPIRRKSPRRKSKPNFKPYRNSFDDDDGPYYDDPEL